MDKTVDGRLFSAPLLTKEQEQNLAVIIQGNFSLIIRKIRSSKLALPGSKKFIDEAKDLKPHPSFIRLITIELSPLSETDPHAKQLLEEVNFAWSEIKKAAHALTMSNTRLCKTIVRKSFSEYNDEIFRYGLEGLVLASYYFKPGKKSFSTYAALWIRKKIFDYFTSADNRSLSRDKYRDYLKVKNAYHKLKDELKRSPEPEEIIALTGINYDLVYEYITIMAADFISLHSPHNRSDLLSIETIKNSLSPDPEECFMQNELRSKLFGQIRRILSRKEMYVLCEKILHDKKFEEIGAPFAQGGANMSRIYLNALKKIGQNINSPLQELNQYAL